MAGRNVAYAQRYFDAALDFFEKNDYAKALEHISTAIENAPGNPDYISTKGVFLHKMNDLAGAADAYRQAIKAAPQHQFSHFNLGLICMKLGQIQQAIQEWEIVIRMSPNDVDTLFNVAVALAQMGKKKEAMLFYSRVLSVNPGHIQTHQNLGLLHRDAHDFVKAKHHLKRLKELDSTYSEVVNSEIVKCEEQEFLEHMSGFDPAKFIPDTNDPAGSVAARLHEGFRACLAGDFERGLDLANLILKDSPEDLQAQLIRGQAFTGLGRHADAIAEFMNITTRFPENADACFHLGSIFFSMNELEKALDYFQRVHRLEPHYSFVTENITNIEKLLKKSGKKPS